MSPYNFFFTNIPKIIKNIAKNYDKTLYRIFVILSPILDLFFYSIISLDFNPIFNSFIVSEKYQDDHSQYQSLNHHF